MKHCVKDIDKFEKLLGIKFSEKERHELDETISTFPLSVTPYYIS